MKWAKRDQSVTIENVIERNTGLSIEEFVNPPNDVYIKGLHEAADEIFDSIAHGEHITIYGDYDADGITSSAILYLMLKSLGHQNVTVILPRRFTEGYGLSMKGVDRIHEGLVVTVDNGISAVKEVAAAREKGLKVVVIDHHLGREDGQIPDANIIVDPNAIPGSEFCGYCGAGLAFKLACIMQPNKEFIDMLSALAAIGTVADVMELVKDNRNIVIRGLNQMNNGVNFPGLATLIQKLGLSHVTEGDIGFRIGPVLNACGRMYDDGATRAFLLLTGDKIYAQTHVDELINTNEERKAVVVEELEYCEHLIEDMCLYGDAPLLLYTTKESAVQLHEGVVGILAGRFAEKYKVPAIVMCEVENGIIKGSGRTYGNIHLKKLLDTASDLLVGYGGHAGAAGLSCKKENIEELRMRLIENFATMNVGEEIDRDTEYYDIEVNAHQIPAVVEKLKRFAPYGEGNPQIVFKINNIRLMPRGGKFSQVMGAKGQHIKMFAPNYDIVAFDMAQRYKDGEEPLCFDAIGLLSEKYFRDTATPQLEISDFAVRKEIPAKSALANALKNKLKEKGFA